MYRKFFQRINILIYLLLAMLASVLQTTIFKYFPFDYLHPDFIFLMVIYFGYKKNIIEGGFLAILTAKILEIHSSSPNHFLTTVYIYTFIVAKALSNIFVMKNTIQSKTTITSVLFIFKQFGILALIWMFNLPMNIWKSILIYLIPGMVAQAILAPICFLAFQEIDLKTWSDAHSEDEYDLNKEF